MIYSRVLTLTSVVLGLFILHDIFSQPNLNEYVQRDDFSSKLNAFTSFVNKMNFLPNQEAKSLNSCNKAKKFCQKVSKEMKQKKKDINTDIFGLHISDQDCKHAKKRKDKLEKIIHSRHIQTEKEYFLAIFIQVDENTKFKTFLKSLDENLPAQRDKSFFLSNRDVWFYLIGANEDFIKEFEKLNVQNFHQIDSDPEENSVDSVIKQLIDADERPEYLLYLRTDTVLCPHSFSSVFYAVGRTNYLSDFGVLKIGSENIFSLFHFLTVKELILEEPTLTDILERAVERTLTVEFRWNIFADENGHCFTERKSKGVTPFLCPDEDLFPCDESYLDEDHFFEEMIVPQRFPWEKIEF
eukprot:snap_masked-scaffold_15-processed-gene-10.4-mRNA-1 protein AED:1.00 eAED:1.00 QI:0/-1/0/0/-1/1/1/0/353